MESNAFSLARWFQTERYANKPEDDFLREELLNDVARAEAVAVHEGAVLVRTPLGACMIERRDEQGAPLVFFDHVRNDSWERTAFWMNVSSVRDLGETLRGVTRASFDALFVGAEVEPPAEAECSHANPVYYDGGDGPLGHGWTCGDCGALLQVG